MKETIEEIQARNNVTMKAYIMPAAQSFRDLCESYGYAVLMVVDAENEPNNFMEYRSVYADIRRISVGFKMALAVLDVDKKDKLWSPPSGREAVVRCPWMKLMGWIKRAFNCKQASAERNQIKYPHEELN